MAVPPVRAAAVVVPWRSRSRPTVIDNTPVEHTLSAMRISAEVKPVASIVVPVLNEAANLVNFLQPLQSLRALGLEVIVVDGGSRDQSVALARPWVDNIVTSDPGRARQQNRGAEVARGDYLFFLHADTRLPPDFMSTLESCRQAEARWGFFRVRLSGRPLMLRFIERMMSWRSQLTGVGTGDQCLFVRRENFWAVGGFADIALMEDIEICRRLKLMGRPYVVARPVITSSRRWQQQGIVKTIVFMWSLRLAYWLGVSPGRLAARYYPARKSAEAVPADTDTSTPDI